MSKASKKSFKPEPDSPPKNTGYIRLETAYLGFFLALIFGIILGSILPQFFNQPTPPKTSTQASPSTSPQISPKLAEHEKRSALDPQNQELMLELANAYFDENLPKKAIKAYEIALSLGEPSANILTDLGIMYRADHQPDKAIEMFRKAQKLDPQHFQSRLNEGVVLYFDLNQKETALQVWKELLKINPQVTLPDGTSLQSLVLELEKNPQ
ncbi:MAG: tetratricopeptide repeat protein [Desulfovibrionaceae bacterium]|nr:tetratricopeptide repeat protein [Desulfovibrionaceae bacterium]